MRVAICSGEQEEQERFRDVLRQRSEELGELLIQTFDSQEAFARCREKSAFQVVIVAFDGAAGQETVIQAKAAGENCRVLWISDDRMFALQGYRLGVADFMLKPLDWGRFWVGFQRCLCKS